MIHLCNGAKVKIQGVIYQAIRYNDNTFEFVLKDSKGKIGKSLDLRLRMFSFDEVQIRLKDKRIVKE